MFLDTRNHLFWSHILAVIRDEGAFWIHQVLDNGMIHEVIVSSVRLRSTVVDSKFLADMLDLIVCASDANQPWVKL